jgi:hypothetical protein
MYTRVREPYLYIGGLGMGGVNYLTMSGYRV